MKCLVASGSDNSWGWGILQATKTKHYLSIFKGGNHFMKNKKFVASAVSAALVASVVAPVVADAATGTATSKTNIKDVRLKSATVAKVYYASNGKTVSKDVKLRTPVKHLSTYAVIPWNGKNVRWNFTDRVELPQQKSFAKYIAKAQTELKAGDLAAAKASYELAKAHYNNLTPAYYSTNTLKLYQTKLKEVESQLGLTASGSVKATSNTTVEVTLSEALQNISATDFTIDGLTVTNAVIKQTDAKTAVLTTTAQTGGTKYTVAYKGKNVGTFTGVSSVVPTSIKFEKTAVNGVVGTQVTLKADIGVKEAGVPVTFALVSNGNVVNDDNNKAQEVLTDANGIATFTYTTYTYNTAGYTQVVAYVTAAPTVRDIATVYWGVNDFLKVEEVTTGTTLDNNAAKTYKVTYSDRQTGKPVSGQTLKIALHENIDTPVDKRSTASVNGKTPIQYGTIKPEVASVTTNSKGEALFTVTGANTTATPIVFISVGDDKLDNGEVRTVAPTVTFAARQATHTITITRNGNEEAAKGAGTAKDAGRKYTISAKTKDGKAAANEIITVALNEDVDGILSTNTTATIHDYENNADASKKFKGDFVTGTYGSGNKVVQIKLDANGEAEFQVASNNTNDYATPVAWFDIANIGKLDQGEVTVVGDKVYFVESQVTAGTVKLFNGTKEATSTSFKTNETATFKFVATNQSGQVMDATTVNATFVVRNTGAHPVVVNGTTTVQPNDSATVQGASINVASAGEVSSVEVTATGTVTVKGQTYSLAAPQAVKATFATTTNRAYIVTAVTDDTITLSGVKNPIKIENAEFKNAGGAVIAEDTKEFLDFVKANYKAGVTVIYTEKNAAGKQEFRIAGESATTITDNTTKPDTTAPKITTAVLTTDAAAADNNWSAIGDVLTLTYSEAVTATLTDADANTAGIQLSVTDVNALTGATVAYDTNSVVTAVASGSTITLTISGANLTTGINAGAAVNGTANTLVKDAAGNAVAVATGVTLTK